MVRASLETWWRRLQQRIRAVATWAGELRGRDMGWIVRGEGARGAGGQTADASATEGSEQATRAAQAEQAARAVQPTNSEQEHQENEEAAPARRQSDRLRDNTVQYQQTRRWRRRSTRLLKRKAVPAVSSTREGIRLWWWLQGDEGSDARGPISVERGRRLGDG